MSYRRTTVNGAVGALLSVLALSLVSCAQPLTTREKGTLAGGTLGAAAGALTGDQLWAQEQLLAEQQRQIDAQRREIQRQREELERLSRQHE